jgi:preprotein translocase subunit Sec63
VLGVRKGATRDQIKTAYRTLIVQYHSDKVAHLGPELRRLAAEKSQQIIDAYQLLEREVR